MSSNVGQERNMDHGLRLVLRVAVSGLEELLHHITVVVDDVKNCVALGQNVVEHKLYKFIVEVLHFQFSVVKLFN